MADRADKKKKRVKRPKSQTKLRDLGLMDFNLTSCLLDLDQNTFVDTRQIQFLRNSMYK